MRDCINYNKVGQCTLLGGQCPRSIDNQDGCSYYQERPKTEQRINPFDKQIGGDYYKNWTYDHKPFELYKWFEENQITHSKAAIIRRILRFDKAAGEQDLDKIIHECELLKAIHYGG